jgi:fructose-bisphosphate aldolase class II
MQHIIATVRAAENKQSPAMVMLFPHSMESYGPLLVNLAAEACRNAKVPVALHLDHEQDEDMVKYAASLPFDSIMVDMSHYDLEENLKKTKELTHYCHELGIAVEAEAGRIEGGEDGLADTGSLESIFTTPEMAHRFIETGIDFLAPCIGNVHGGDPENLAPFDFER